MRTHKNPIPKKSVVEKGEEEEEEKRTQPRIVFHEKGEDEEGEEEA